MGSGVSIDELLSIQLRSRLSVNAMNGSNGTENDPSNIESAVNQLQAKLECILNGTFPLNHTVEIDNGFLSEGDIKLVQYWMDWMDLDDDIEYGLISNFMSINSNDDTIINADAFGPIDNGFNFGNG